MKAMVLCAGYGTRLGSLTQEIPKPMLSIQGRPLLSFILGNLKRQGIESVIINLHFKPEIIRKYFTDGSLGGMQITYSMERELLGTAGGLKNVMSYFKGEKEILVHYGDVVTNQDFSSLLSIHRRNAALATLLLHQRVGSNSLVTMNQDGRIQQFLERPRTTPLGVGSASWVNSGVCVCSQEIFDHIPDRVPSDLAKDVFAPLADKVRLFGCPLTGYRRAIDSAERLQLLGSDLASQVVTLPCFADESK